MANQEFYVLYLICHKSTLISHWSSGYYSSPTSKIQDRERLSKNHFIVDKT